MQKDMKHPRVVETGYSTMMWRVSMRAAWISRMSMKDKGMMHAHDQLKAFFERSPSSYGHTS